MAYIKVTIDGETVLDGESGTWEARPPEFLAKEMANVTASENAKSTGPWMRALMLVIAEAVMTKSYTEVEIKTSGSGWSLNTRYAIELGP